MEKETKMVISVSPAKSDDNKFAYEEIRSTIAEKKAEALVRFKVTYLSGNNSVNVYLS